MPGNRPALAGEDVSPSAVTRLAAAPRLTGAAAAATVQASPAQGRAGFGGPRGRALLRLISPVVLLVVWQLVSDAGIVSVQKLPPPTQIWSTAGPIGDDR